MDRLILDGNSLSLEQCSDFLAFNSPVTIEDTAIHRMEQSREVVEQAIASGKTVYGVNTGFGKLSDVRIDNDKLEQLQANLVRSHAAGVGDPIGDDIVRLILLFKINALAKGNSGCRALIAETLAEVLNAGILPVIPAQGSVGASGDLAPLSHLALTLMGEGIVQYRGKKIPAMFALKQEGVEPVTLKAKEGLAILNGTQVSLALGVEALLRLDNLVKAADIIGAMSVETLQGTDQPFRADVQEIRAQDGQVASAKNLYSLLQDSEIHDHHRDCGKVQDMYSLRCMPQVHGACRNALEYARPVLSREMNSSTDNPIVFPESGEIVSGGNFNAEPVGMVLDSLSVAAAELASISERRIASMMDPQMSQMPPFLTENSGLQSGYMLPQITAASLVSENKVLAHPASVDSIPTSANQEDHVSMAPHAGRKLRDITANVENVFAIEWLCAAQGLDLKKPLTPAKSLQPAYRLIREHVPPWEGDRSHEKDIHVAARLIKMGMLVKSVSETHPLK
ncbi:MAG: histidine ammonia-lyase [Candidatus Marinimicrobia bacterium]|nr:histidine ammonia-lyase [Candidatus Neomarinimicrobiota bacterium]MCF7828169.1 histidine ammonia-lyase [Candidatus Neomarinimicrobiota bacterium]MCF7879656.1 histidine ammonia-lyase [Candidatus Neomarinimicrobiota bacterium]